MKEDLHHSDIHLFHLIADGDEEAFRVMFHRHNERLFPFIRALIKSPDDAQEVVQEMFLQIWLQRRTLKEVQNPVTWLNAVAYKTTCGQLRKDARYRLRNIQAAQSGPEEQNLLLDELDAKYTRALINEAIDQLPAKRREVFRLSRIEGYSRREIAEKLAISENTVRNQLVEAVAFIQEYMQKNISLYVPAFFILMEQIKKV